jgi:hypothetical protein
VTGKRFIVFSFQRQAAGFGEEVEQRFLFYGGGSVLVWEPEDLDAGNGVEVWVAMHEDETRRVCDSGDESIGQRQTTCLGSGYAFQQFRQFTLCRVALPSGWLRLFCGRRE